MIAALFLTLSALRIEPVARAATPSAPAQQVSALSSDTAHDATGEGLAFVETLAQRTEFFVHEPIQVTVRFGLDEELVRSQLVALFQQPMDVPVQLTASWWDGVPHANAVVVPPRTNADETLAALADPPTVSFALGETIARATRSADRIEGDRRLRVFEVQRTLVATRAGELVLDAPILRFAHATSFADDFLKGRVALDRRDVFVRGAARSLAIRALPEEQRPLEFTGAVGRFSVRADIRARATGGTAVAHAAAIDAGESVQLLLHVQSDGDLGHFDAPRLDGLAGFQVNGVLDETVPGRRTFTYDLAPRSADVRAVPAIAFAFFDPAPPAGYRVVRTEPIPITVRAVTPRRRTRWVWWLTGAVAACGLTIACLLRRRALAPLDQGGAQAREAADTVRASATDAQRASESNVAHEHAVRAHTQMTQDFTSYLAARLRCSSAAVIGADLALRLAAAGAPAPLATRAAVLHEALVAARFGGPVPLDGAGKTRALVEELEAAFRASRPPR
ncbi:MAG: BatD family protein [Planctomycetota bacterium]